MAFFNYRLFYLTAETLSNSKPGRRLPSQQTMTVSTFGGAPYKDKPRPEMGRGLIVF